MATPILDAVTVTRFVLDDFPVTDEELVLLSGERERWRLDDCALEVAGTFDVCVRAVELWRERRIRAAA